MKSNKQQERFDDPWYEVRARLEERGEVRKISEDRLQARCPAHDDRRPSLSATLGSDGRVLLKCHAGCTFEAILSALQLSPPELFPRRDRAQAHQRVQTYDYLDRDGSLVFQVVRRAGKKFLQRRRDKSGNWVYNIKGVVTVPYRLPGLLQSSPDATVFVAEGEKDVNRLSDLGLVATCNAGGAGKWHKTFSAHLEARDVVILPDNDDAGRKHAEQVRSMLEPAAKRVRVVDLPDLPAKGDVSDWLDAGHSKDDLLRLVEQTPGHAPSSPRQPENDSIFEAGYELSTQGFFRNRESSHGAVREELSNFTARITSVLHRDNGLEREKNFEIVARLRGKKFVFSVAARNFDSLSWVSTELGPGAIVGAGAGKKDHTRVAIQQFSKEAASRTVYTHLGWVKIAERWVYLHAGGAIGAAGTEAGVEVEVDAALQAFTLPSPPTGRDAITAVTSSLRLFDIAPTAVAATLLAAVYRAVLDKCDFAVHLCGPTGVFKSELAALAQQHFGPRLDARHLPGSWSSTDNALEGLLFQAKDSLVCIDDFAPAGSQHDVKAFEKRADRIFRGQGNNSGRARMRFDGSLRPPRNPRSFVLSTGEDIPSGHSIRARMLILELEPGAIEGQLLTGSQEHARAGRTAQAMSAYLCWVAGRRDEIIESWHDSLADYRRRFSSPALHNRTPENLANLAIGFRHFLNFAEDIGAVGANHASELDARVMDALTDVGAAQSGHHSANNPALRFIEIVAAGLASGQVHVADENGGPPPSPGTWGWRERTPADGVGDPESWQLSGDRIGWLSGTENLYLNPEASFFFVQKQLSRNGEALPVAKATLHKRLHQGGFLKSTEQHLGRGLTVRKTIQGARLKVLHLNPEVVMATKPDQSDQFDRYEEGDR